MAVLTTKSEDQLSSIYTLKIQAMVPASLSLWAAFEAANDVKKAEDVTVVPLCMVKFWEENKF